MTLLPLYDVTRCDGCGLCVSVCKCGALAMTEDHTVTIVQMDDCGWCGDCELVCETGALQCPFEVVFTDD